MTECLQKVPRSISLTPTLNDLFPDKGVRISNEAIRTRRDELLNPDEVDKQPCINAQSFVVYLSRLSKLATSQKETLASNGCPLSCARMRKHQPKWVCKVPLFLPHPLVSASFNQ